MPNHALVIGRAQPAIITGPAEPVITIGGAAALITLELIRGETIRPTLLTAIDEETYGKATVQLMDQHGMLYRAIPTPSPTPTLELDASQPVAQVLESLNQDPISREDLGHALGQTVADYDHVVADCNLAIPVLEVLARTSKSLSMHGTSADRCLRLMSTQVNTKKALTVTERQVAALQQANKIERRADLTDLLRADYLLVTGQTGCYELYHGERLAIKAEQPAAPAPAGGQDYGVTEAAMAGLLAAVDQPSSVIKDSIDAAIGARLEFNAELFKT